jgi:hypothetical protein
VPHCELRQGLFQSPRPRLIEQKHAHVFIVERPVAPLVQVLALLTYN